MEKNQIDQCPVCGSLDFIREGEICNRVLFRCICGADWSYPKELIMEI